MTCSMAKKIRNHKTQPKTRSQAEQRTPRRQDQWDSIFDDLTKNFCPKRQAITRVMRGQNAASFFAVSLMMTPMISGHGLEKTTQEECGEKRYGRR